MTDAMKTLGQFAITDIRESMNGLTNKAASTEAARLAELHNVTVNTIYNLTQDLRPKRKTRADKGKRAATMHSNDDVREACELVALDHLDPDQAIATITATRRKYSDPAYQFPISLASLQKELRERGLGRKQRRSERRPFVRWESDTPGEIYQFDISAVKERWFDLKTRRILRVPVTEVSLNHRNDDPNRVQIWKFTLVDDYSRYPFVRFVQCRKPNGTHVVQFLNEAYREMGVPLQLYSDNDTIIKNGRNAAAAKLLNKILADSGGYELVQHLAGNSQASGKVENAHQWVEKAEKYFGLKQQDEPLTLEMLNRFAIDKCQERRYAVHRGTLEIPAVRFNDQRRVMRIPPPATLDMVFLADQFTVKLRDDLTFAHKGQSYTVPSEWQALCFSQCGQEISVTMLPGADFFILIDLAGNEHEIPLVLATPQKAGEFKSLPQTATQRVKKELRESAKARKEARKDVGQKRVIPHFDTTFDTSQAPAIFPQRTQEITVADIAAAAPGLVPPSHYAGVLWNYWKALETLVTEGVLTPSDEHKDLLRAVFGDAEQMPEMNVREGVTKRLTRPHLTLVRKIA